MSTARLSTPSISQSVGDPIGDTYEDYVKRREDAVLLALDGDSRRPGPPALVDRERHGALVQRLNGLYDAMLLGRLRPGDTDLLLGKIGKIERLLVL